MKAKKKSKRGMKEEHGEKCAHNGKGEDCPEHGKKECSMEEVTFSERELKKFEEIVNSWSD